MTTTIGPNFPNELAAAGLAGLPITWGADGVNVSDPRLTPEQKSAIAAVVAAHNPATPDPGQLFASAIAAGLAIASASTPALDGIYAIDPAQQAIITGIAAGIAAKSRVPGGGATFTYPDVGGRLRAFTQVQFLAFAAAVEDYVYALSNGQAPAQPVAIA